MRENRAPLALHHREPKHFMSTLYLIRHGQASFGSDDYDNLSSRGRHQARLLGEFMLHAGIRMDACWSGPLRRQRQTADEIMACYQDAAIDIPRPVFADAFGEYDYESVLRALIPIIASEDPPFIHDVDAMLSGRRAFQKVFGRVMVRWASGDDRVDTIVSWSSFGSRVIAGIREIVDQSPAGSHVVLFTSGGPIAAIVGHVLNLAPEKAVALSWQLVNASLTRLQFSSRGIGLDTFNEKGHLEQSGDMHMLTYR